MLRRCLLALCLTLLVAVPAAQAGVKEDASASVGRLLDASINENWVGYCDAMAPSFRKTLFDSEDCAAIGEALAEGAALDKRDEAVGPLNESYRAANVVAAVESKGAYVTKRFTLKKLAAAMRELTDLNVVVAGGAKAAAGTSSSTVVLSRETKAHRIVLYREAADGTIYRLVGTGKKPKLATAGKGVPEPPVTTTYKVVEVGVADTGRAYVAVQLIATDGVTTNDEMEFFLVEPVNGTYLVSEILIPLGELIRDLRESLEGL